MKNISCNIQFDSDDIAGYLFSNVAHQMGYHIRQWVPETDIHQDDVFYILVDASGKEAALINWEQARIDILGIFYDCFNNIQRAKSRVAKYLQHEVDDFDHAFGDYAVL